MTTTNGFFLEMSTFFRKMTTSNEVRDSILDVDDDDGQSWSIITPYLGINVYSKFISMIPRMSEAHCVFSRISYYNTSLADANHYTTRHWLDMTLIGCYSMLCSTQRFDIQTSNILYLLYFEPCKWKFVTHIHTHTLCITNKNKFLRANNTSILTIATICAGTEQI